MYENTEPGMKDKSLGTIAQKLKNQALVSVLSGTRYVNLGKALNLYGLNNLVCKIKKLEVTELLKNDDF